MLVSMHPEELRETMEALGCTTQSALAAAIGVDRSTISLWLDGRVGVPRPVSKLLRLMRALCPASLACQVRLHRCAQTHTGVVSLHLSRLTGGLPVCRVLYSSALDGCH